MKLTVIGCSTPLPRRDQPCSGYLVSAGDATILLDCGSGVFAALLDHVDPRDLSAVWISHMHPDHSADLVTLANWAMNTSDAPRLSVFAPEGWDKRLGRFLNDGDTDNDIREIFDVGYVADGQVLQVGDLRLASRLVRHSVVGYGVRITNGALTFAYSGDSGSCNSLEVLARDADLFLCEAGATEPAEYHLTIQQAQGIAQRAGVRKLLLTHIPESSRPATSVEVAVAGGEWLVGA